MRDTQDTPRKAALADAMHLIEGLEFGYLVELQTILNNHINARRKDAIAEAKDRIRKIAASLGMTPEDVVDWKPPQARYRDPATGRTWNGHGREPGWLAGKRDQYRVA